ncbi:MAG: peptide chain release factor 2, partial [Oscillospiraceae bacterium]|nr:peptide chain release factor 2 [Oscillospiraceae bacterium]
MLLLDELRVELEGYRKDMKELYEILDIDKAKSEIAELQEQSGRDGFWDDIENSQKVMQTIKHHEATIESYSKLNEKLEDALTMIELAMEEED